MGATLDRLHDQLQHVVRQSAHTRIPVRFAPRARIAVDCTDDEREEVLPVIVDEPDDLVVVPEEQRPFCNLYSPNPCIAIAAFWRGRFFRPFGRQLSAVARADLCK